MFKGDGTNKVLSVNSIASSLSFENNRVCYTLDGVDDMVTFDADTDLDFRYENDFTVAVWMNTSINQNDPVIFGDKNWGDRG